MAEMDLLQLQAFADNLAGVVLDQVEADRGLDREKIANAMMGHIVKFGLEQRKAHVDELRDALKGVEMSAGMGAVIYGDQPSRPAPKVKGHIDIREKGGRLVNSGVHIECQCDECQRRRKLLLCGCEMCMHHTEAAAYIASVPQHESDIRPDRVSALEAMEIVERRSSWNAQKEYLQKIAQRRAMREMYVEDPGAWPRTYVQDVKTVTVQLYRLDEKGQRQPVVMTPDNARYLELAIRGDRPVEVINGDTWFFPDGLVMTGMELAQIGRTAVEIWAVMRRRTSMFEASGIGKRSVWADFIQRKNKEQP